MNDDHQPRGGINFLSSLLGALVVLVVGAVLVATGVVGKNETKREVVSSSPAVSDAGSTTSSSSGDNASGRSVADIYKQEGRGVVYIRSEGVKEEGGSSPFGEQQGGTATGSGFVVDKDGTIVTNAHVVEGASKVSVSFSEDTSDFVDAKVQGSDVSSDLAVLKVDPKDVANIRSLPLGDSKDATVGQNVIAIGNPFGFTRTVTTGIVSAVQRTIQAQNDFSIQDVIQTDAAINPGNSGGPLLDSQGRVIGINAQIASTGNNGAGGQAGSIGIGFAIPVNTLKKVLPDLKKGESIKRGFLGVTTAPVTDETSKLLRTPVKEGASIQNVVKGGPSAKAGLRAGKRALSSGLIGGGDVITKVDGQAVKDSSSLVNMIAGKKPGEKVEITYVRGSSSKERTTTVTLGNRPQNAQSSQRQQPQSP